MNNLKSLFVFLLLSLSSLAALAMPSVADVETTIASGDYAKAKAQLNEVLKANPQATVVIMMNATGLTRRGVEYQLKKLKTVQKIRRIGPDKGGYWEVLDKNI